MHGAKESHDMLELAERQVGGMGLPLATNTQ